MKKIVTFIICMLIMIPIMVNAECSSEELETYKSFAKNIKHNLELAKDNTYTINFLNIPDTLIVGDIPGNIYKKDEDKKTGLIGNSKYNVLILANEKTNCPYATIENRWIDIPKIKEENKNEIINNSNYLYFILGGIVLLGIIVFVIIKILKNKKKSIL